MIYNNYPDDYIVINAKWVEWDNDEQRWFFMTEDAFEKAQSLADYTKQVRKEVIGDLMNVLNESQYMNRYNSIDKETLFKVLDQLQGETK